LAQQIREPLSRDRVLDAALRAGDELGLAGLSMRRIARELGVEAMSLYNHFPNKAAIISSVLERAFAGIPLPERDQPWASRLRAVGSGMYRTFAAHPVLAVLITTGAAAPSSVEALRPIDEMLAALYEAGFDDRAAAQGANALTALIFGSVQLQPARASDPDGEQQDRFRQELDPNQLPHLHRAIRTARPSDPSADFEYQLNLLIAGLESTSETHRLPPG
jgi:AcrR family transcriptional regulator